MVAKFKISKSTVLLALLACVVGCSEDGAAGASGKAQGDAGGTQDVAPAPDVATVDATTPDVQPQDVLAAQETGKVVTGPVLELHSIAPSKGKASGGETAELTGAGFEVGLQVLIGTTPVDAASVFVVSSGAIQVKMPPHETGLVDVAVVIPGPTPDDPPRTAKIANAYLYYNDVVLASVTPAEGPVAGGTPITIKGTGFAGDTHVLVGGKTALGVQVLADDTIACITPPGIFGAVPVHVSNERGVGVMKKGYFYTAAPAVTSLAPAAGPTAGGTQSTVSGSGFTKQVEFSVGGSKAAVLEYLSPQQVRIATPPGQAGKADVTASTKHGIGTLLGGFVYDDDAGTAATSILSVAPASGPLAGGNQVVVVAHGLVSKSDTTLLLGNKAATITGVSPANKTVIAVAPQGSAPGAVDVVLMTSKGSHTQKGGYTYVDQLSVKAIAPAVGPIEGGTKVTITGSGFTGSGFTVGENGTGKPNVKIGALPATAVVVVSDKELQAVTAPGSVGYVDVAVTLNGKSAVLKNGFQYAQKGLKLFVAFPSAGAQAGGTLVHLYGLGFQPSMQVTFGGKPATHFTFVDPGHATVRSPPGKVGAVDVVATAGKETATLQGGFVYFNPLSTYGGTWGNEVDGSVNVTVLESKSNKPVADAFVMLWTDPTTPYQGFTNQDGQITFSGEGLNGKQMVSASKPSYESASVVLFDATNVTLHIQYIPPPTPGAPPPGVPPPSVSGKVVGLDKYVMIPTGSCQQIQQLGLSQAPQCSSCNQDSDCAFGGPGLACVDLGSAEGNNKRCLASCAATPCQKGFQCIAQPGAVSRCVPQKGEPTAICYHTKPYPLATQHKPPEGALFEATPANGFSYKITTGYGEFAVVCFGGYKTHGAKLSLDDPMSMFAFTPTMMGVKRHVMTGPGAALNLTGVNVALTIPLNQKANLRLDVPHQWPVAPGAQIIYFSWAEIDLGADGVIQMPDQAQSYPFQNEPEKMVLEQLPAAMTGDIFDASMVFIGAAVEYNGPQQQDPVSVTVKQDVKQLHNDAMVLRLAGGDFEAKDTGVKHNIYGMWGTGPKNLHAVGAKGTIVHWDGGGWTMQATPAKDDLKAIHGTDATHIWAVGWNGSAAYFDGTGWKQTPVQPTNTNLNGVFAGKDAQGNAHVWAAATNGIYKLQPGPNGVPTWQKYNPSTFSNLLAIHGSDADHVWAVGTYGQIWFWNGQVWKYQASNTSIQLRSVWAAGPESAYAVGEKGQILRWDGKAWTLMASPVQTTLTAVTGSGNSDVWAVGQRGVVLHFDGKAWTKVAVKEVDKVLSALWVSGAGDFFALGEQELVLGPLLYPPLAHTPKKNGILDGYTVKWQVDPQTVEPHFNYAVIGIPGLGPDTPVWNIMAKGNLSEVELPDFPSIQGTPGIPKGKTMRLTVMRVYKEGFDIDAYDGTDLNQLSWRSWAFTSFLFTRP
jgi:hypothetical protein